MDPHDYYVHIINNRNTIEIKDMNRLLKFMNKYYNYHVSIVKRQYESTKDEI